MRILMAVPKYPFPVVGGLERQAYELAKALVKRGHAVYALSGRFDPGQADMELIDGVRVYRWKWIESRPARFLLFPFSMARTLLKLRRNVDLVHVHNTSWFGVFMTLFAKLLGLPVITKLPNIGDFGIPGIRRGPFGFLRVALLKGCDGIVAMTPESVLELNGIGYPKGRILKVTNGVSLHNTNLPVPETSGKIVNAVFVGRLSVEKGLTDLLHSWAVVKARATHASRLRIVGEGPQADELRGLTLALQLGDSVEFAGFCEDVPAELAKSDLFVLPSYAEGNSNAIFEAMRACLPIVATRVGGAAIQVGRQGEHFLVPLRDRRRLTERLLELIENETLRRSLGEAMRDRVERLFSIDTVARTYEQAYELILRGRGDQIGQINPNLFDNANA